MDYQNLNSKASANYDGFSLVSGGLIYSITQVFRNKAKPGKALLHTALALVAITWLPLCVFALIGGTLNVDDASINFLEDFLMHVRFLLVVPFLILIEKIVDKAFVNYIKISDDLIPDSQQEAYNRMVSRLNKLSNSYIPEIVVLLVVYTVVILAWNVKSDTLEMRNYILNAAGNNLSPAGWYYLLLSMPIFQLLVFRWIWRWFIWMYSLVAISRFKLYVDPLHADQMGGLEYMNLVPLMFSFILMAPSAVLSSFIGIEIIYNDATLKSFALQIFVYIFLFPIVLYAPLLVFMPFMLHAKSSGIYNFGSLLRKHNEAYVNKWIRNYSTNKDALLGSVDHSSLSDSGGSYAPLSNLKIVPINLKLIAMSFVLYAIPYIPLVFTYYSVKDLIGLLIQSIAQ